MSSYRFDLEKAIAAWRRTFEHNKAFASEDIEELEGSLRDRVAALVEAGSSEEAAFREALRRMGSYATAETEYRKVYWGKRRRRGELLHELHWRLSMLKNYLKIAFRNLLRQKGYSLINIAGLAVGLASCFFILLWVQDELRHDRFLEQGDRIHVVWRNVNIGDDVFTWRATSKPLAAVLEADYPEIEQAVHTFWGQGFVVTADGQSFREFGTYADADFFNVFAFPFIEGNPQTALQGENSIVITDRTARKFFGEDWKRAGRVLGQTLTIDHRKDFAVTGVIEDIPHNSSIQFDVLLPIEDFYTRYEWPDSWGNNSLPLYVKLRDRASLASVNEMIADVVNRHEEGADEALFLQPFEDVYLHSEYQQGRLLGGRIEYVRIFSVVAVFLLLIASINFMNLATARSARRSREVGVRKAIGASQKPVVIWMRPELTYMVYVRTMPGQTDEALAGMEAVFKQFNPEYPFDYRFLDQEFETAYRSEAILGKLSNLFAFIAIFISCLGLLGLVSFSAEQRTKEIGVRKVMGASLPHLVRLLTGEVTMLVLIAVVIAAPVSYYAIRAWLSRFEYHVDISFGMFVAAAVLAVAIAWLTVSYQAIKAALADPVKSLRYE